MYLNFAILAFSLSSIAAIESFSIYADYPQASRYELAIEKTRVKKKADNYLLFYKLTIKNNSSEILRFMLTDIDIRDAANEWHLSNYDSYAKLTRQYLSIPPESQKTFSLYLQTREPGTFVLKGIKFFGTKVSTFV